MNTPCVGFTVTQLQRLRELGESGLENATFVDSSARDAAFKELERKLTANGRAHLQHLREEARAPGLVRLEGMLADALRAAGLVRVSTPHIISAEALRKMGIPADDPLVDQVFWLDRNHCLRPMLAPNLYTLMRRLARVWTLPFGIFEIGTCFRRDSSGSRHLDEFTMLNLVELGTPIGTRHGRLQTLAKLVMDAANVPTYSLATVASGVYGDTVDVIAGDDVEVCSAAMGPHPLDDAWAITDPWVGLGFGLERLLLVSEGLVNVERAGRSLSYLDGVRLSL